LRPQHPSCLNSSASIRWQAQAIGDRQPGGWVPGKLERIAQNLIRNPLPVGGGNPCGGNCGVGKGGGGGNGTGNEGKGKGKK
jgi:hypothetical protein